MGNDIVSIKIYGISATALWCYDYFLTLEDEVEFAWKTENMLIFVLFMISRYLPVPFLIWTITSSWSPSYTAELCQRTAFLEILYFIFITFIAHVVLTLRIHAITKKNKWIALGLYGVTILQFGVGLYLCVYSSLDPQQMPQLDLDSYRLCMFNIPVSATLVYTSFSLAFDVGVFFIVLVRTQSLQAQYCGSNIPNIVGTISRDTEIYFLVIFSTQFLLVLMLILVRPTLRFLPTVGNAIFLPMMITRIILSLKKAASTPQNYEMIKISAGRAASPLHINYGMTGIRSLSPQGTFGGSQA